MRYAGPGPRRRLRPTWRWVPIFLLFSSLVLPDKSHAQDARGYRFIAENIDSARVAVSLVGSLQPGQTLEEELPAGAILVTAWAAAVDPGATDSAFAVEIPVVLLPPFPGPGGGVVQPMAADGATSIAYVLNVPLGPVDMIAGQVVGGDTPGAIEAVYGNPFEELAAQIESWRLLILARVNNVLCTAFSIIPGPASKTITQDCGGSPPPYTIGFRDSVLDRANIGHANVSIAVGTTDAEACANRVESFYTAQTILPFTQSDFAVGAAFQIIPSDLRNVGKRAAATVTIEGGELATGQCTNPPNPLSCPNNPYGFEGQMRTFAVNPFSPPPAGPPAVPAMGVVSDRVQAEFLQGTVTPNVVTDSSVVGAELIWSITAAPLTCTDNDAEPQDSYSVSWDDTLFQGGQYAARGHMCSAAIAVGMAGGLYNYLGNTIPIFPGCSRFPPIEFVLNQERGLRFEHVKVEFHHMDLEVIDVVADDYAPLDGVITFLRARITNKGVAPAKSVGVFLYESPPGICPHPSGAVQATAVVPFLAAGDTTQIVLPWSTCGKSYTNPHTLCVYTESATIAETEYADNCASTAQPIVVQASRQTAFVSLSDLNGTGGGVKFYDTRLRLPFHTFVIPVATSGPAGVAVPNHGKHGWVALQDDRSVIGFSTRTAMALGNAQAIPTPNFRFPGAIGVDTRGAYAFVPYNTGSSLDNGKVAVYGIDSLGAQPPVARSLTFGCGAFWEDTQSSVVTLASGRGKEEVFLGAGGCRPDSLRIYRIPLDPLPISAAAFPNPVAELQHVPPTVTGFDALPAGVGAALQPLNHPQPGMRAIYADRGRGYVSTVYTTEPAQLAGEGSVLDPSIGHWPSDLTTDFDRGKHAYSTFRSFPTPHFYQYSESTRTVTQRTAVTSQEYWDLAFAPSCGVTGPASDEVWVVDRDFSVDVFASPAGIHTGSIPMTPIPRGVHIAPIPLYGKIGVLPPPIPVPFPFPPPVTWPPNVDSDFDFVRFDRLGDEFIGLTKLPVVNVGDTPAAFELSFPGLPAGWTADWDPEGIASVPSYGNELANVRFALVRLTVPAALMVEEATLLRVVANPVGEDPDAYAETFLRAEALTCAEARDDDGTREDFAAIDFGDDAAEKTVMITSDLTSASGARIWLYGQAYHHDGFGFVPGVGYSIQVNGISSQTIPIDLALAFDQDTTAYRWLRFDVPLGWLEAGANTIRITEDGPAADPNSNNLRIGVDVGSDADRSWWANSDGTGCPSNPPGCVGELMVFVDVCTDCNHNGIGDATDIASGTSQDTNANGIPDECETASGVDEGSVIAIPRTRLHTPYPNPFNPTATLRYDLAQPGHVEITVYDARGARVRSLVSRWMPGGAHEATWDGRDDSGRDLASGVYLVQLRAGAARMAGKVVLLK